MSTSAASVLTVIFFKSVPQIHHLYKSVILTQSLCGSQKSLGPPVVSVLFLQCLFLSSLLSAICFLLSLKYFHLSLCCPWSIYVHSRGQCRLLTFPLSCSKIVLNCVLYFWIQLFICKRRIGLFLFYKLHSLALKQQLEIKKQTLIQHRKLHKMQSNNKRIKCTLDYISFN